MLIARPHLLEALKMVAPALSTTPLVPILTHVWFTGHDVMAYNDYIAIAVPLKTDFVGAIPGGLLLNMLGASGAKDVDFIVEKNDNSELLVKAAGARIRFPVMPEADFLFEMPALDKSTKPLSAENANIWIRAIEACLRSVTTDTTHPDQLGITIIPDEKGTAPGMTLYSTNSMTMSRARIDLKPSLLFGAAKPERVVLPTLLCKQMVELAKASDNNLAFQFDDNAILIQAGKVRMYGKLIEYGNSRPLDYEAVYARHMESCKSHDLVDMPKPMRMIVNRAVIMATSKAHKPVTEILAKDGKIKFTSQADHGGQVVDWVAIKGHPNATLRVDPALLKEGVTAFSRLLLTKDCVIMANDVSTLLISVSD